LEPVQPSLLKKRVPLTDTPLVPSSRNDTDSS
jgi:hypothetical protein